MLRLLLNADTKGKVEFSDRGMSKKTGIPYQQVRTIHQKWIADGTLVNDSTNAGTNANHVFVTICDYVSYNVFNIFSNAVTNALKEKESIKDKEKLPPHTPLIKEKENNKEKEDPNGCCGKNSAEKKKQEKKQTLDGKARNVFVEYYNNLSISDEPYYCTGKDAGAMRELLNKIKFSRKSRGLDVDDDSIIYALNALLNSISDQWILQHHETTTINSKYNEIVANAKKANDTPQFPPNPKHGDTIGYDWFYDAYGLHRWIKDKETDDRGRVFSVQNGRWLK
jgi:hypothetical protein